jgi:hypothetical protein
MGETATAASNLKPQAGNWTGNAKPESGSGSGNRKLEPTRTARNSASANARFKRRRRGPVPGISI